MKKEIGVIYARYSHGPHQSGQSIEGQVRDCMAYAQAHGIEVIKVYADRGISGKDTAHRPEFLQMMKDASEHKFGVIIAWKTDRLGRNRLELLATRTQIRDLGIELCYAMENIPRGPEGIIMESVMDGMAEYYSAELAQKIRRGQRESVLKGIPVSRSNTFGYRRREDRHMEADPEESAVVLEIFRTYAEGTGLRDIIENLVGRGITFRGLPWSYNNLRRLLSNEIYIGVYHFGELESKDVFPAIVSEDLWEVVKMRLEQTSGKGHRETLPRNASPAGFMLSGKICCAVCGSPYCGESGKSKSGKIHYYYKCQGQKRKATVCDAPTYRKEALESVILKHTLEDVLNDEMIQRLADDAIAVMNTEFPADDIKRQKARLAELDRKGSALAAAIADAEGYTQDKLIQQLNDVGYEVQQVKAALALAQIKRPQTTRDEIVFYLEQFRINRTNDPDFEKKIFDRFIAGVAVDRDCVYVAYNLPDTDRVISRKEILAGVRASYAKVDPQGLEPKTDRL